MRDLNYYLDGIKQKKRRVFAQAITLMESNQSTDRTMATKLLKELSKIKTNTLRIGVTGTPGVGKSTFIEAFGLEILKRGLSLCVLAVDPSSKRTGGSILGDKTRMPRLSREENCFIRPSPNQNNLGGVASATNETIALCEAFGFDVVLIETVGVGQSETIVSTMVDFFLLLLLPGSGDELQGIKKGVMELADGIFINKCDMDVSKAKLKQNQIEQALHLFKPKTDFWSCKAMIGSALNNQGISDIYDLIESYVKCSKEVNFFEQNRKVQNADWFKNVLAIRVIDELRDLTWFSKLEDQACLDILKKNSLSALKVQEVIGELKSRLKQD
ncbi:MAG: methylmalonyl Co-A mutase-associated GTPase MeaB [Candidatus Cloacimonetes bacterium]|nr:methylmalonyl Co-A mutase-associated GTPase MeaB [Candidatus Cloacimonadota bacterium]